MNLKEFIEFIEHFSCEYYNKFLFASDIDRVIDDGFSEGVALEITECH